MQVKIEDFPKLVLKYLLKSNVFPKGKQIK